MGLFLSASMQSHPELNSDAEKQFRSKPMVRGAPKATNSSAAIAGEHLADRLDVAASANLGQRLQEPITPVKAEANTTCALHAFDPVIFVHQPMSLGFVGCRRHTRTDTRLTDDERDPEGGSIETFCYS
jgi:hypothetical protein